MWWPRSTGPAEARVTAGPKITRSGGSATRSSTGGFPLPHSRTVAIQPGRALGHSRWEKGSIPQVEAALLYCLNAHFLDWRNRSGCIARSRLQHGKHQCHDNNQGGQVDGHDGGGDQDHRHSRSSRVDHPDGQGQRGVRRFQRPEDGDTVGRQGHRGRRRQGGQGGAEGEEPQTEGCGQIVGREPGPQARGESEAPGREIAAICTAMGLG